MPCDTTKIIEDEEPIATKINNNRRKRNEFNVSYATYAGI